MRCSPRTINFLRRHFAEKCAEKTSSQSIELRVKCHRVPPRTGARMSGLFTAQCRYSGPLSIRRCQCCHTVPRRLVPLFRAVRPPFRAYYGTLEFVRYGMARVFPWGAPCPLVPIYPPRTRTVTLVEEILNLLLVRTFRCRCVESAKKLPLALQPSLQGSGSDAQLERDRKTFSTIPSRLLRAARPGRKLGGMARR